MRQAGHQHRRAERRLLGQPARPHRTGRPRRRCRRAARRARPADGAIRRSAPGSAPPGARASSGSSRSARAARAAAAALRGASRCSRRAGPHAEARASTSRWRAPGWSLSAPLWALFAAAIKLEDGGPVFFRQERVGLGGRPFTALKFRSMRPDAEAGDRRGPGGRARSARHAHRPLHARDRDGRAAAAVEHPARRHELRRSARAAARRDRGGRRRRARRGSRTCPGFAQRITVRPGLTGARAGLRAARRAAPPEVPLRPDLRAIALVVARSCD